MTNDTIYTADGIYLAWSTFLKTIRLPANKAEARFAKGPEACSKDVERAFGLLQSRWAIVRHPAKTWSHETMWEVMIACVAMHNMIVEYERVGCLFDEGWESEGENVAPHPRPPANLVDFLAVQHEMRDKATHIHLQKDLAQHMWNHLGNN
jgi:hypothetical protein